MLKINVFNHQSSLDVDPPLVKAIVKAVISLEHQKADEVSIYFVTRKEISSLHERFFNDPSPTDCLSFPLDEAGVENRFLGEVFVCPQQAIEYARTHKQSPYHEMTLYIVHGLLHLLGYDDIHPNDRKQMRAAEKKQMNHLKHLDLLLGES